MERMHTAKRIFERNVKRLRCPICHGSMKAVVAGTLLCKKGHAFDFSKRGYVNLAGRGNQDVYGKTLFQARRRVFETGIFDPLTEIIREMVLWHDVASKQKGLILDAGCGEGYHLRELAGEQMVAERYELFGIDLAREGVALAAGRCEKALWAVADLANLPLRDRSVSVLLSVLSPANYGEFNRVLDKGGTIIKVVPEADYLKEIRLSAQPYLKNKAYSNEEVTRYAQKHMKVIERKRITYEKAVSPENSGDIVNMTPMTAGLCVKEKEQIRIGAGDAITIDLTIMAGQKP